MRLWNLRSLVLSWTSMMDNWSPRKNSRRQYRREYLENDQKMPRKLQLFVEHPNLSQVRTSSNTLAPSDMRIHDPSLTEYELYMIAIATYLPEYIDAYETACKDVNLQNRVMARGFLNVIYFWIIPLISLSLLSIHLQLWYSDIRPHLEQFEIRVNNSRLSRMRVISRHKSQRACSVFLILYQNTIGFECIVEWFCECLSGLRAENPCGHIITLLGILRSGFESPVSDPNLIDVFNQEIYD